MGLIGILLTTGGTVLTGLLDFSSESTEDEFTRLERVTDRLEAELEKTIRSKQRLARSRDSLYRQVQALKRRVGDLSLRGYRLENRIDVLMRQLLIDGKTPAAPLMELSTPQLERYLKPWIPKPDTSRSDTSRSDTTRSSRKTSW